MTGIDYQKQMTETVYVNLPGPREPTPGMTGGELLHGFLVEIHESTSPEVKAFMANACSRWNIVYRMKKD